MKDATSSRRFNPRAFVSSMIALTAMGLPVTGIANHVLQMEPMTVSRHAWMSAHNSLAFLFVVFVAWHVLLNRRVLFGYARGLVTRAPAAAREVFWALAIVAVTTTIVVLHAIHLPLDVVSRP